MEPAAGVPHRAPADLQQPGVPVTLSGPAARPSGGLAETAPGPPLEVDAPAGRVVVYVTHLVRPHLGPRGIVRIRSKMAAQRRERDALLASARAETAPVILAGDFNTSDRSRGYRRITGRFRDAGRSGPGGPTYVAGPYRTLLLRIDYVFVPRDWCSADPERFDLRGSDHRGVAVDVGPCPAL